MLKNSDIHIRDPFVLPIESEKKYYLYGTRGTGSMDRISNWN